MRQRAEPQCRATVRRAHWRLQMPNSLLAHREMAPAPSAVARLMPRGEVLEQRTHAAWLRGELFVCSTWAARKPRLERSANRRPRAGANEALHTIGCFSLRMPSSSWRSILRCASTNSRGVNAIHCARDTSMNCGARNNSRKRRTSSPLYFGASATFAVGRRSQVYAIAPT